VCDSDPEEWEDAYDLDNRAAASWDTLEPKIEEEVSSAKSKQAKADGQFGSLLGIIQSFFLLTTSWFYHAFNEDHAEIMRQAVQGDQAKAFIQEYGTGGTHLPLLVGEYTPQVFRNIQWQSSRVKEMCGDKDPGKSQFPPDSDNPNKPPKQREAPKKVGGDAAIGDAIHLLAQSIVLGRNGGGNSGPAVATITRTDRSEWASHMDDLVQAHPVQEEVLDDLTTAMEDDDSCFEDVLVLVAAAGNGPNKFEKFWRLWAKRKTVPGQPVVDQG
jgi:hypothetical protein